mgnify:CR=1 FL=1
MSSSPNPDFQGRIAENIMYFARLLRAAGLAVGTGKVMDAVTAVRIIGIGNRQDLDLNSVLMGKSVDFGGRPFIQNKTQY